MPIDLNHDLEAALDGPVDLVTTSALLDLVSETWLDRLAVEAAARRLPVYAALSYDGRIEIDPSNPFDPAIIAAVNTHQRTRQGIWSGARAGGGATPPSRASKRFGYSVIHGEADWVVRAARPRIPDGDAVRLGESRRASSAICRSPISSNG